MRLTLLLVAGGLALGSVLLLVEGSDLFSGLVAVWHGAPMLLPDGLLLGFAVFLGTLAFAAAVLLWPAAARFDRDNAAVAAEVATELARFRREFRTRDKARRAEVARAYTRWEAERKAARPARTGRAAWVWPLLGAVALSAVSAVGVTEGFPHWLSARGYASCPTLDAVRWVHTRQSRGRVEQFGWALPQDCPPAARVD